MKNVVLGMLVVLSPAAACTSGARQEAAQVAEAMDRFRKADNATKPSKVGTLRAVKCSVTDVCQARDACLASAEATAKSLSLKSEVEQALVKIDAGTLSKESPEAKGLALKLDETSTLLDEGYKALPACDDQIMALKRKYAF